MPQPHLIPHHENPPKLEAPKREHLIELLKATIEETHTWMETHLGEGYPMLLPLAESIKKIHKLAQELERTDQGTTPLQTCWEPSHQNPPPSQADLAALMKRLEDAIDRLGHRGQ